MIGTLLGNYRVVERLGQGGMGEVYVGRHEALGHRVVVKVLLHELSREAEMVRRFYNEAQAATAIRHAGIAQVFDFGTAPDGRAYIVMELLEGETLAARLERQRLDDAECCRIGRQVANVLQAAHARGIMHRDLKPENLFLVPDDEVPGGERVKVLDFGIAKLAGEARAASVKTRTGRVMGTPEYMSPEQCRGAGLVDARSDIYSLGCILFELVCGRPPFVSEGVGEIVGAHLHVAPPHPRDLAPDVAPKLGALIAKMLAKAPAARPQTMAAVCQALDEILATLKGPARSAPRRAPVPQTSPASTTLSNSAGVTLRGTTGRTHRWLLLLGSAVTVGGLVALAIAITIPRSSAPAPTPAATTPAPPMSAPAPAPTAPAPAAPTAPESTATTSPTPTPSGNAPASPAPAPDPERPPAAAEDLAPPPRIAPTVEVAIDSTPPGASVLLSKTVLGKTPYRGSLPRGERDLTLVLRLRGYTDRALTVRPDRPISQRIKLAPLARAQPPQPQNRDYSVNPFGP